MQNFVPDAPEWKLVAFAWLPIDRWSVETLIGPVNASDGYCKICDKWIPKPDQEKHVKAHIAQEKTRREKRRLEGLEKARQEREATRKERELAKENYKAVEGKKEDKPKAQTVINSSVPKSGKVDKQVVVELEKALRVSGEHTLVSLSEGLGIDLAVVRKQIGHVPGIQAVGIVSTGKRGRPPVIYGLAK